MTYPPSFTPQNPQRRPSNRGAQHTGSSATEDSTRVIPSHQATSSPAPQRRPIAPPPEDFSSPYTEQPYSTPSHEHYQREPLTSSTPQKKKKKKRHFLRIILILFLIIAGWIAYLIYYGNSQLAHVDAISQKPDTPGTTYLIVGSDKREEGGEVKDNFTGQRTDSIILLQVPDKGTTSLISIPRDSLVDIKGHGKSKINAAYSWGGQTLLIDTIETLTSMHVDHYLEVSMESLVNVINAVDGVELCYDSDVDDHDSKMKWTAGCHTVDGAQALAFSRMRKSDPQGDIGRAARQRQVIAATISKVATWKTAVNPVRQRELVGSLASNITTDNDTTMGDLLTLAWNVKAMNNGGVLTGTPPISNVNYRYKRQSCVLLNEDKLPDFWAKMRDGNLEKSDLGGVS
ncbi:MAG: LCP family protein [Actinomycetaceae bacterium]|nr:LCP family protein [Actinomycetaceae bacterium]